MGSVMWNFKKMGAISIPVAEGADPYAIEEKAIDAGAEDTEYADNTLMVYTSPENLTAVRENLEKADLKIEGAEITYLPSQKVSLSQDQQLDYEKLLETLDDQDDVQEIFDNVE